MKMSIKDFKSDYISHPLKYIILAAMILRLVSAFFAKGYGMHDDHFLVIESSYSWVKGYDYNHWLPSDDGSTPQPSGHSFFYPALHFLTFSALDKMGIASLDAKMYIIRILHALFSLLTVFFAYKLTFRASGDRKTANLVGWTTAILWCLPWLSVRNLVEIFCIPFLLGSTWFYVRKEEKPSIGDVIISGLLMGCAFSVRFQVIFFIGGFGLAMLIYKRWRDAVLWSVAVIAAVCLTQISDLFVWGEPFVELREYVNYNFFHSGDYLSGSFFKYFGVLLGLLAPPLSVLLLFGFFYGFRRLFLFLPAFCFLLFHSLFPNKQERFIFPIIPSVLILGFVGCYDFYQKYKEKRGKQLLKTFKVIGIISLVINLILLVPVTVHYSKRARVESMVYLSQFQDVKSILVENTNNDSYKMFPKTYSGYNFADIPLTAENKEAFYASAENGVPDVDFIFFDGTKNLDQRVAEVKTVYPDITFEADVKPSFIDKLLHRMNPRHIVNEEIVIYRNNPVRKNK